LEDLSEVKENLMEKFNQVQHK